MEGINRAMRYKILLTIANAPQRNITIFDVKIHNVLLMKQPDAEALIHIYIILITVYAMYNVYITKYLVKK